MSPVTALLFSDDDIGLHHCRYNPECTTLEANPGIAFAPSGIPDKLLVNVPEDYASIPTAGLNLGEHFVCLSVSS